jgi:hypothetical protein
MPLSDHTCCAASASNVPCPLLVRIGGGVYPEIKEQDYNWAERPVLRTLFGGYSDNNSETSNIVEVTV